MKIDAGLRDLPIAKVAAHAAELEALGFDGLWTFETQHDPFLALMQIALGTEHMTMGPNIAIAFARSPFSMAMTAWDIQLASKGRLLLGLGTQVRAHIERRFSMPYDHPARRVVDYIRCLRAIWATFQTGAKPDYRGEFYQFTLMNDFFNPGPIEQPDIPVYLAGVNPRMARAAGEAADGFSVHPMHSPGYLRDVIRPAVNEGAKTRGLTVDDLVLYTDTFIVDGETETQRQKSELTVRQQIAFYASTPSYRAFLAYHDKLEIAKPLSQLMREGNIGDMHKLVDDDLLAAVAVSKANGDVVAQIKQRYAGGLVQRILPYAHVDTDNADYWRTFVEQLKQ